MKIFLTIMMVLLLLCNTIVFSQTTDTVPAKNESLPLITLTRLDTLNFGNRFNKDWKYHSGDDAAWAEMNFDDSSWPEVDAYFKVDSLADEPWKGIGWFRYKFKIDSTLYNQQVGFRMIQSAASEIYLNGKLIQSFGKIDSDPEKEELYNPNQIPFAAVFDTSSIQVLAIRYSTQNAQQYYKRFGLPAQNIGFDIWIGKMNKLISYYTLVPILSIAFAVFFLAFTLLNLLMFFFYHKGKENLYFALFTGSLLLLFVWGSYASIVHSISDLYYILSNLTSIFWVLLVVSFISFQYAIFYKKMPRQYWAIVIIGLLFTLSILMPWCWKYDLNFIFIPYMLLVSAEGLRVIIHAIWKKKRNAVVIGSGVAISILSIVEFAIITLGSSEVINLSGTLIVFLGVISLPITMSIYQARERAQTKTDIENQIVQVQELSLNAIEHEKREAELKVENARKEVELQKAAELKSAYHNLEVTHENLKSTQSQLIQSEKMASLGQLTAGIAHEIQNPLNFVNNFSEISNELVDEMKEELTEGRKQYAVGSRQSGEEKLKLAEEIANDIKQNLEKINHHGKRADAIVKGMLQHSRSNSGHKEPTDINALADEYLRLSYHGMRAKDKSFNAEYKTDFDLNLPKINVVPQDIGRVILNLINNAFYAVTVKAPPPPEGGIKERGTDYKPIVIVRTSSWNPPSGGRGALISVSDNGPGIPLEIKDKIFQPFFTTKPTGQGTGLGLSLAYDIVKAHGGELKVETKEGEGSEFIIELPNIS